MHIQIHITGINKSVFSSQALQWMNNLSVQSNSQWNDYNAQGIETTKKKFSMPTKNILGIK